MFPIRLALAATAGVLTLSGPSFAGQPVDLMAPTPLLPPGAPIQQVPRPPAGVAVAPSATPESMGSSYLSAVPYLTALMAVSMALAAAEEPPPAPPTPMVAQAVPPPPAVVPAPPPEPMITKALLPGHWQLGSWQYHWVPPETQLRTVETHQWVQGHYVWLGGVWNWVPSHYGDE